MNTPTTGVIDDYLEGLLHDVIADTPPVQAQRIAPDSTPAIAAKLPEDVEAAVDAVTALVEAQSGQATAPVRQGPSPEELAAMVLAEADADPALAGIMSGQTAAPVRQGPTPEELAAMVLAEADTDPALAGIMSGQSAAPVRQGPTPEELAAMVLAEADADPALAGIMSGHATAPVRHGPSPEELAAMVLAEADADPALAGIMSAPATAPRSLAEADEAAALTAAKRIPMAVPPERRAEAERAGSGLASPLPPNLQAFMPPSGPAEPTLQHRRARDRSTRWLRLRCGEQAYALELLKVQEVVLPVPLLPLRGTPPAMLGIMNLRGQVVPVIDLGLHLGAAPIEMDTLTRVVVLEEHGETLGLRVSAVEDVTSLTDQQIEPPDNARICRISNDLFRGVARLAGPPMILLDAEQLLH